MMRTFATHEIRKQTELSGKLWDFCPLEGEYAGQHFSMPVPGCWETYPGFENYRGSGVYESSFVAGGNIRLEFKGISHHGTIYVDDVEVVSHYNAYTPFEAIVKDLHPGLHHLKVVVDNSFKPEYALNRPNDYMSYGGISRGVILEEVAEVFLETIHATPRKDAGGWTSQIEIVCRNISEETKKIEVEFVLNNQTYRSGLLSIEAGSKNVINTILDFTDAEMWSPESPRLYEMKATLFENQRPCDDLIDRMGFRTITIKEDRIMLNDKPIRIKGLCRHEDHPQYGNALPFQAMMYDLSLMKDLGANSVRTAHYPNDEIFLDLCDEMGILVWEEHHLRGGDEQRLRNPNFQPQAEQVIEEMITLHYNHPSIYIWGIMNESASETEFGRESYVRQYNLIRKLDTSRPCSSATCKYEQDICLDLPDVVSWNMYPYWYEDKTAAQMIDEVYRWTQNQGNGAGKPFMITEIGAGAIYGFRSPDHDKWTEEYQAEAVHAQLTEVMAYKGCMGLYIWQFCDVRVSKEWFDRRPRTRNNKGIVDEFRRRKLSYDVVKRLFSSCSDYWDI